MSDQHWEEYKLHWGALRDAEQIRWTRLYSYLTGCAFLFAAWAALATVSPSGLGPDTTEVAAERTTFGDNDKSGADANRTYKIAQTGMTTLATMGAWISLLWMGLGLRGGNFVAAQLWSTKKAAERYHGEHHKELRLRVPSGLDLDSNDPKDRPPGMQMQSLGWLFRSKYLVTVWVPCPLFGAFVVLLLVRWIDPTHAFFCGGSSAVFFAATWGLAAYRGQPDGDDTTWRLRSAAWTLVLAVVACAVIGHCASWSLGVSLGAVIFAFAWAANVRVPTGRGLAEETEDT